MGIRAREKAIPIHEDAVWEALSFTRGQDRGSSTWTGRVRSSLNRLDESDGTYLEQLILGQAENGALYPVDESEWRRYLTHRVRRLDKVVSVSVPEGPDDEEAPLPDEAETEVRESLRIQALIADIGTRMNMKIWVPRNDRSRVMAEMDDEAPPILDVLPLNYDDTTLRTIEQIDVLWLKGRAIVRAFEVEHSTSIYSGILRMADLLALQPNMDIKLHIVAPYARRDKVFREIQRPVFSFLDRGPLAESCTYISYESLRELAHERLLAHLSDRVLDEFAEEAE